MTSRWPIALATLALTGCAAAGEAPAPVEVTTKPALAYPLPPRGRLTTRAHVFKGPRVMTAERVHQRTLVMYGDTDARSRLLVAGCVNGRRCAGTGVVNAAMLGCPPTDAEFWFFATLNPNTADLDADPAHPGAAAWRQAVADLRPSIAIVFRTGPRAVVHAAGPSARKGRRYAHIAGLPFEATAGEGLAAWAGSALAGTASITVELPGERVSARRASRLAYAIDRLAGTRFAAGAMWERRNQIAHGFDPRDSPY